MAKPRRFEALEALLRYRFEDQELLQRALTHRSYANEAAEALPNNETLEFLGDAVLEFVIRDLMLKRYPDFDEGRMTQMKVRLVNAANLAYHARELDLGEHLFLGRGEDKGRGRQKSSLLADAFEAIVAAIYLDGGLRAARRFITRRFRPQVDQAATLPVATRDHKSALQEQLQARNLPLPIYEVASEEGPDHAKTFTVVVRVENEILASASGRTKKEAQQLAAAEALHKVETMVAGDWPID